MFPETLHQCLEIKMRNEENTGVGPKAQEVTEGSILLSCLSIFFFLFFSCSRQCLLIPMIIIAIHLLLTAFFIVSVVKAVQELLQHKAVICDVDLPMHRYLLSIIHRGCLA